MDIAKSLHDTILLYPPNALCMIKIRVIVHISSGRAKTPYSNADCHDKLPHGAFIPPWQTYHICNLAPWHQCSHQTGKNQQQICHSADFIKQTEHLRIHRDCHNAYPCDTDRLSHPIPKYTVNHPAHRKSNKKGSDDDIDPIQQYRNHFLPPLLFTSFQ